MFPLLLSLPLLLAPQDPAPPPSEEAVEACLDSIEESLAGDDREAKQAALRAAAEVPDARVVRALTDALADDDAGVREAAVAGLRWMDHTKALEALHRVLARDRRVRKDPAFEEAVVKGIGQHADPSSIEVLEKDAFRSTERPPVVARLFALGRIRDRRAVETLLRLARRSDAKRVGWLKEEFRLSLTVLTGVDRGPDLDVWQRWWTEEGEAELVVAPERPKLPRPLEQRWLPYWELERGERQETRREDRGRNR